MSQRTKSCEYKLAHNKALQSGTLKEKNQKQHNKTFSNLHDLLKTKMMHMNSTYYHYVSNIKIN